MRKTENIGSKISVNTIIRHTSTEFRRATNTFVPYPQNVAGHIDHVYQRIYDSAMIDENMYLMFTCNFFLSATVSRFTK